MNKNNTSKCSGCGVCIVGCPVNAIEQTKNQDGFLVSKIDTAKCVGCGMCEKICSFCEHENSSSKKPIQAFVYQSHQNKTIQYSTSGGACNDLAIEMIRSGGLVCGAVYDLSSNSVEHIIAKKESDLSAIQGSKYLQSDITKALKELICIHSKAIVFGTPCQISALNNLLKMKNRRNDYVLVDFFCHGVPSYNVWNKYIKSKVKSKKLKKIVFRDKKYGWGKYCISLTFDESVEYSTIEDGDFFLQAFLGNICLNESCYEQCTFHSAISGADIRVSDSWGLNEFKNSKGSSAILVYTDKGLQSINCLYKNGDLIEVDQHRIFQGQKFGKTDKPLLYNAFRKMVKREVNCDLIKKLIVSPNYYCNVVLRSYIIAIRKRILRK